MSNLKILINLAAKSGKHIPTLGTIAVKDNIATASDMDMQISCPVDDIADGLYSPHGFEETRLRKRIETDLNDFPIFENQGDTFGSLSVKTEALQFVSLTQSNEEDRYYLNGVCILGNRMTATDGHRINMANLVESAPEHKNFKT